MKATCKLDELRMRGESVEKEWGREWRKSGEWKKSGGCVERVWKKSGGKSGERVVEKEWGKKSGERVGESSGLKGECRDCVKQSINKHVTQTI